MSPPPRRLLSAVLFAAVVLYGQTVPIDGAVLLVTTAISATCGLAAVGTLYGGLAAGFRGRETLLPLLTLPAVAPVLIGATRAVEAALGTAGAVVSDGWSWVGLLCVFAVAFGVGGIDTAKKWWAKYLAPRSSSEGSEYS